MNDGKSTCGYDMTKRIVMGPYFKYEENSIWFSNSCNEQGEVRVIEGILCHAVNDIEILDNPEYDMAYRTETTSRRVVRWQPVTEENID